jgi:hypothetical protein
MRKRRVESCLTIGPPRGPLDDDNGVFFWDRLGWRISYFIYPDESLMRLYDGVLRVVQKIELVSTEPQYGGVRWWFKCPKCCRRVARLHRPSHTEYFFCRHCYGLTYESVQSSHSPTEAFFKRIACDLNSTLREARRFVRLQYCESGAYVHEVKRPGIRKVRDRRTGISLYLTKEARKKGLSL